MIELNQNTGVFPLSINRLRSDIYYGMSLARIGPGLVIARDANGNPICSFDDNEWSFPAYALLGKDNPNFYFSGHEGMTEQDSKNLETCKRLFLVKMFAPVGKTGEPLRLATMHSIKYTLHEIWKYASEKQCTIQDIFADYDLMLDMVKRLGPIKTKNIKSLASTLSQLDSEEITFTISGPVMAVIKKENKRTSYETDQHPVIPSRILWDHYCQYKAHLKDFIENQEGIENLVHKAAKNPVYGRSKNYHVRTRERFKKLSQVERVAHLQYPVDFKHAIEEHKLTHLCKKYEWDRLASVASFIGTVQYCAKNLVHMFTLMRDHEVRELTPGCVQPTKGWKNEAIYLVGMTTKLFSKAKEVNFITVSEVLEPINVLTSIHDMIVPYVPLGSDTSPLLLSLSALPFSNGKSTTRMSTSSHKHKLKPVLIQEDDIVELETIDPLRDWRSDRKFQVGKPWNITSHQFRRSIAVFAGQTGLITLPSMKRLLVHLTRAMAMYYMQGCGANNYMLRLIDPELAKELYSARQDADAAMYLREVLNSVEVLQGFHGRRAQAVRVPLWRESSPEQTAAQVKRGLDVFIPTVVGGCTHRGPCDKRAHANFTLCDGCAGGVISEKKVDETIELIKWDIAEMKPGSIEYEAELKNLEDFENLKKRVTK
ncbi:integrase [Pseudomonas sp. FEN]|uniref:integrase n=1 Tax=Pseudomonas sp. FEN TaxID=2767468 RepID=UPI00174D7B86|nr:integrase [Pseudomonas sp. FEN]